MTAYVLALVGMMAYQAVCAWIVFAMLRQDKGRAKREEHSCS